MVYGVVYGFLNPCLCLWIHAIKWEEREPSSSSLSMAEEAENNKKTLKRKSSDVSKPEDKEENLFEESIRCPCCYKVPREGEIRGCPNGHFTCFSCNEKLKSCPICRSRNISIRNRPVEEFLAKQAASGKMYKCQNDHLGCQEEETLVKIKEHEIDCSYRLVSCCGLYFNKCTYQGPYNSLMNHIVESNCGLLIPLQEAMKAEHTFPPLTGIPDLFTQNQKISWRPICYTSEERKVFAYIFIRREMTGEWILTCHSYLPEKLLNFGVVKFSIGKAPVTTCSPSGASVPDEAVPADKRPSINHAHPDGAITINCPRPAKIYLTVRGQNLPGKEESSPYPGICFVSVGSELVPEPESAQESEMSFTYQGNFLQPYQMQDCTHLREMDPTTPFLKQKELWAPPALVAF